MDAKKIPACPDLEQYKKQAKELVKAWNGDERALQKIVADISVDQFRDGIRQRLGNLAKKKIGDELSLTDAQFLLAREHAFESWPKFAAHIAALNDANSGISKFELAADAIMNGDVKTLKRLLKENPALGNERSDREHNSTLLHYVSANGIEDFRQVTPNNIVEITRILLEAGADVNSASDAYGGGSTTLGLAATSMHPRENGTQNELLELLLGSGAYIDEPGAGGNQHSAVRGSLANGCPEAAELLAARGAKLDLIGAAGIGRLDVIKNLFASAEQSETEEALRFAAGYGRNNIVTYLLNNGTDIQCADADKQTPLHWALFTPQVHTVKLLLERGARLNAVNIYGGDVLGQALWSLVNNRNSADFVPAFEVLLEHGAVIEDGTLGWLAKQKLPDEVKTKVEELLRKHGADS